METIKCECKAILTVRVLHSNAGHYIGYWCDNCGPYSRISEYYETKEIAESVLATMVHG